MPRKKSVWSLQRLCLENVAENMQPLWAKDYMENYLDEYQFCYIEGPFNELAGSLVHELLRFKGKRLTRPVLHLLLVPQLTELSLSICPKLVNNTITQMITLRCKNLSSLDLLGCSRIPAGALVDLVEGLPCLAKLNLAETQSNTQVLSAVGSSCQRLRELNISRCKRLSPESLFHLAYDPTGGTSCCPALQILSAEGLESRPYSKDLPWALAFLLLALPCLASLENESTAEAVCLIYHEQFEGARVPAGFPSLEELVQRRMSAGKAANPDYELALSLREVPEVCESLLLAVMLVCPEVAKVAVLLEDTLGQCPSVLPWEQLRDLTLGCMETKELVELLPMMELVGAQLHSLSIDGYSLEEGQAFPLLFRHCPVLQKFSACLVSSGKAVRPREAAEQDFSLAAHMFPELRHFTLSFTDLLSLLPPPPLFLPLLQASLVSLLSHAPRLESLMLLSLPFSLDGLLGKVLASTSFPCLRSLSLVKCKVSSPTVHQLVSLDNPLHLLDLDRCPDIYRKDYDELLRRVRREHLDLQVKWK